MNDDLEIKYKEAAVAYSKNWSVHLEGLRRITKPRVRIFGVPTEMRADVSQMQVRRVIA
jgi:hypothetical protein